MKMIARVFKSSGYQVRKLSGTTRSLDKVSELREKLITGPTLDNFIASNAADMVDEEDTGEEQTQEQPNMRRSKQ
jgi:hypothetical protein